jgi:hypothetical protein
MPSREYFLRPSSEMVDLTLIQMRIKAHSAANLHTWSVVSVRFIIDKEGSGS